MKIVAHLNDGKGLISTPVILIEESNLNPAEQIVESIPSSLNPTVFADRATFPDQKYINAWTLNNGVIGIDIVKARDILRDRIRAVRLAKLSALDIEFQRALETGADTSDIVSKKQVLRDAPANPAIDLANTTAELDALLLDLINS